MNKVLQSPKRADKGKPEMLRWANFDVKTMKFIQRREGGGKVATGAKGRGKGRGVGFYEIDSMTLEEAVKAGGIYLSVAKGMARQVEKISKELKRLGLIP